MSETFDPNHKWLGIPLRDQPPNHYRPLARIRWFAAFVSALSAASAGAAEQGPFADAVAVWHMAGLKDPAGKAAPLSTSGKVEIGVELSGAERDASLARGGDGRVATFDGGFLDAGQAAADELETKGERFTLCVRLRDPSGQWMAPLFSKHGGHDALVYNLFSADLGQGPVIGFELGAERTPGMTQVFVPLAMIGEKEWHDVICRYDGAKLQLFVDGVWMDEGFPMGPLRKGNREPVLFGAESIGGAVKSGWRGMIDHVAMWSRALSDAEVAALSGGAEAVAAKQAQYLGATPSMQYFRPHNQFNVGDTLPFFRDGTFHFYYLLDRGHHSAKGGRGAHQWAHAISRDLVHWTEHPLAVPITREGEGSICTGSVFFHGGTYYAFYATRDMGGAEKLSLATGDDGIRFTKTEPNPFLAPGPQYGNGFRDPNVFIDERTGLFHLIVSTILKEGNRGCLAQYTSKDLKQWEEVEPIVTGGNDVPECPDYFRWNDWYYLLYSNGGIARYRMSKEPLGPWRQPAIDVIDGQAARVMKTAAFTGNRGTGNRGAGNRRIGTAFLAPHGYAGWAVFRELLQNDDGTLGSAFVPEMIPPTGPPAKLTLRSPPAGVSGDGGAVRVASEKGAAEAVLTGLPANGRLQMRIDGKAESIGLRLGTSGGTQAAGTQAAPEIRFSQPKGTASIVDGPSLASVKELEQPFTVDVVLKDNILDLCVGGRRTLIAWSPQKRGDQLVLFVENGAATFDQITASPLR